MLELKKMLKFCSQFDRLYYIHRHMLWVLIRTTWARLQLLTGTEDHYGCAYKEGGYKLALITSLLFVSCKNANLFYLPLIMSLDFHIGQNIDKRMKIPFLHEEFFGG